MAIYNIPFCYLPNSKVQTIDTSALNCLRSEFQIQQLHEISQSPDFAYFVILQDTGEWVIRPEFEGPYTILWYDKAGQSHYRRIGKNRIIQDYSSGTYYPEPLDSVVYQCRTI